MTDLPIAPISPSITSIVQSGKKIDLKKKRAQKGPKALGGERFGEGQAKYQNIG
eukprot:CAMPEP_0185589608 /NCGR_PEP_ID=MMETSP0434-20130131/57691_1 /TAXON_ID=626734 ORGANISM="Favella taraikaensis, Strain Fe Narragansett Bay" /NCGR_SAMPLE_ID=MMETSP0434 /ASSEMBLY_ACC=CAM_ASM_000379 /LENGTH=53 /DNA_ID=CAMNT_0028213147 /DNA_START=142 /DNA_END=299 /DNA_ORIENTATION=+